MKMIIIGSMAFCLTACISAPTRLDVDKFKLLHDGAVAPSNSHQFADCLLDRFGNAHWALSSFSYRQQRRSDSFRVETLAGPNIVMSADIFDDGKVQLFEADAAALVNTSGEREAFDLCLKQYSIDKR